MIDAKVRYNSPMFTTINLKALPKRLLNIVLPPICHICRSTVVAANEPCLPCITAMSPLKGPLCKVCGSPFYGAPTTKTSERATGHLCGECTLTPPPFKRAFSAVAYTDPIRESVRRFKYYKDTRLAKILGALMVKGTHLDIIKEAPIDLIIPIPLHKKRLKERGFNQSLLLANVAAKTINAPVDYKSLRRIRHTTPQVRLRGKERAANIKGAFEFKSTLKVKGKTILLIDDVYTTGSTIRECGKVLKEEGAHIIALTLARAL